MTYTKDIKYHVQKNLYEQGKIEFTETDDVPEIKSPESPVYRRANEVFNQKEYMYPAPPVYLGQDEIEAPEDDIYVLRLLIKEPGSDYVLPKTLEFLKGFIQKAAAYQKAHFPDYDDRFVYITVRSGELKSVKEDEFHVDGFQGISVPRHIPEQNYIWLDKFPTLFSMQPYFVENLDPGLHNFHEYFNRVTDKKNLYSVMEKGTYIIDPYHVHARPDIETTGTLRTFVRICYSPVEIRDDTNTPNIWLPRGPYNREDIRNRLKPYQGKTNEEEHGLRPV